MLQEIEHEIIIPCTCNPSPYSPSSRFRKYNLFEPYQGARKAMSLEDRRTCAIVEGLVQLHQGGTPRWTSSPFGERKIKIRRSSIRSTHFPGCKVPGFTRFRVSGLGLNP